MRILIAGTIHFSPACRQALCAWLAKCKRTEATVGFIGVEADQGQFEQVLRQRQVFETQARAAWPSAVSDDVIRALSQSILLEADTHQEFYADVPIVWLDRGRSLPAGVDLSRIGEERATFYGKLIESRSHATNDADSASTLRYLSSAIQLNAGAGPSLRNPARDAAWYRELSPRLADDREACGILICGVEHSLSHKGNIAELLELSGHEVVATDLLEILS